MAIENPFVDYIVNDVMSNLKGLNVRSMFGGYSIYKDGTVFAMIVDDKLYFKVDSKNITDFKKMGWQPFTYEGKGKRVAMSYYEVPEDIYEDKEMLEPWIDSAIEASLRSKKVKK